jgi:hypothetical protein
MSPMAGYHTQDRRGSQRLTGNIGRGYVPLLEMANTLTGRGVSPSGAGVGLELYVRCGKYQMITR